MAFSRKTFLIFSLRTLFILTLGGLFLPSFGPLHAAPILVQETTVTESSTSSWFEEANTQMNMEGFSSSEGLASSNADDDDSTARLNRGVSIKHNARPRQAIVVDDNDRHGESSLKQLLRSYLNTSNGGGVQNITPKNSKSGNPSPFLDTTAGNGNEFLNNAKETADDLLAKTVSFVLQPGVSENNLMTFSILGFGEFTLFGGKDGFVLSIGDMSLFLFGNSFENGFESAAGGESEISSSGGSTGVGGGAASGNNTGAATQAAYFESGEKGDGEASNGGSERQTYSKGTAYNRMLAFIIDVLTYPATFIILLGVLIFNFIKTKRSGRSKKKYQRSSRSRHRRARSYRKRTSEEPIPPTKQVV